MHAQKLPRSIGKIVLPDNCTSRTSFDTKDIASHFLTFLPNLVPENHFPYF